MAISSLLTSSVIASLPKGGVAISIRDCFVAIAPRNDKGGDVIARLSVRKAVAISIFKEGNFFVIASPPKAGEAISSFKKEGLQNQSFKK